MISKIILFYIKHFYFIILIHECDLIQQYSDILLSLSIEYKYWQEILEITEVNEIRSINY